MMHRTIGISWSGGTQLKHARLEPESGALAFTSSYDAELVAAFKAAVPADCRKWDPVKKRWLVSLEYGRTCADLAETYLGVTVAVPAQTAMSLKETRLVKLEYLGACKDRGGDECSAFAWVGGGWNMVFPESVLRGWFEIEPTRPGQHKTLFGVLGIKQNAVDEEIKRAYRRLAKLCHPDVNHEPTAAEDFRAIQTAYETLIDPVLRRKYQAGLALEASLGQTRTINLPVTGFRSPIKCGWILVEGEESLGRFVVSTILDWKDIVREDGLTMVSSWPAGADQFTVDWV